MATRQGDAPRVGRPATIDAPRETIRAAAARLFAEQGYEGTSLQDIARAVKVTKAAVYHYFPTKQDIFDAIVLSLLNDMRAEVLAAIASEKQPDLQLRAFLRCHAGFIARNLAEFRTMFGSRGGTGQVYTPEQIAARAAYEQILRDILSEGAATGALMVGDLPTSARAILGMLNWLSRWFAADGDRTAEEIADGMAMLVLNGLLPRN